MALCDQVYDRAHQKQKTERGVRVPKHKKGVQSGKALYAIFLQKALKFTVVCGIISIGLSRLFSAVLPMWLTPLLTPL